jgi:hypothetical protein
MAHFEKEEKEMNTLSSGYRPWIWPWWKHYLSPSTYYYYVKYKWQRAQRGWADCDVWSLDGYLIEWLPDALQRLKDTKHGIPGDMFPDGPEYLNADGYANKLGWKIATDKWNSAMTKMIEGFRAKKRAEEMDYPELGPFPHEPEMFTTRGFQLSAEQKDYYARLRPLQEADEQKFKLALKLFTEHFESLWD